VRENESMREYVYACMRMKKRAGNERNGRDDESLREIAKDARERSS